MKTREKKALDSNTERQIVLGMITSTQFLKNIAPIYRNEKSFKHEASQIIAGWCLDYFNQFNTAPNKNISDIFRTHRDSSILSEDQIEEIEYVLTIVSEEFEEDPNFNADYSTKQAEIYFRLQSLQSLKEDLMTCIIGGRVEDGEHLISDFKRVVRPQTEGINPLTDKKAIDQAFDPDSDEFMFRLRYDLGKMLGPFRRGSLSIIVASMGRGKTWFLQEVGLRALYSGFNVLFISLEMTQQQMMRRIHYALSAKTNERWKGKMLMPVFDCKKNQIKGGCHKTRIKDFLIRGDEPLPDFIDSPKNYLPCTDCRGVEDCRDFDPGHWYIEKTKEELTAEYAIKRGKELTDRLLRGKQFKLLNPPPGMINVSGLRTTLDNFEYYENWVPDVIITDYADKFASEEKVEHYRHKVYNTILAHKALAMDRECCVITASQSNTGRNEEIDIKSGDFAEDIRKKAEADIAWSLNQTSQEKKAGVMRVAIMKERHDDFNIQKQCMVLQNLKIGQPHLDSCFIPYKKKEM